MGFLASIFGKRKTAADKDLIFSELDQSFVMTDKMAAEITQSIINGGRVVFSEAEKDMHDAAAAFKIARKYLDGRHVRALELHHMESGKNPLFADIDIRADELKLSKTFLSAEDWGRIASCVQKGDIKKLTLKDVDKDTKGAHYPPFQNLEAFVGLDELTFNDCSLRDVEFSELANRLISKSSLKKLNLGKNYARNSGLNDLFKALPDTLEELNLHQTPMCGKYGGRETLEILADKVEKMPNLKVLDLSDCDLDADDLRLLMPKLPPSLKVFNLKDDHRMTDEGLKVVIEKLKAPNCNITETNAANFWARSISADLKEELKQAEQANAAASMAVIQRQKAAKIAEAKGEKPLNERIREADAAAVKTLLHPAVQTGLLPDVFDRMKALNVTLTEKDLNAKNDKGETFVQACIKMKQVETLMRPEAYAGAKDYQAVYNSLPDAGKKMFDGKDGRPAFVKMKNQLMANAVKKAVSAKSAQKG